MKRISDWSELARAIGPHLMTDDPLASLRAAGFELGDEMTRAFDSYERSRAMQRELTARLRPTHGDVATT